MFKRPMMRRNGGKAGQMGNGVEEDGMVILVVMFEID